MRAVDLYEAMRCAPTTRRFKPEPVPAEVLMRALDAARFAPSGGNRQGWRVIVVQDAERACSLRDLYLPAGASTWSRPAARWCWPTRTASTRTIVRNVQRADEYANGLERVPVHLVVGVRLEDLAVTDAKLPRQSIVGGARSTRSCRTCCWRCAPRASARR